MKTLLTIFGLGLILTFSSCFIGGDEGPVGPQGPRGPQGADGLDGLDGLDGEEAYVFDFSNVSFTGPEYRVVLDYANDFVALDTDVTLVYFDWSGPGDEDIIWRALPQTIITDDGLLQYNYDFTIYDVQLFLDAQFPLDMLTAGDTDNWNVRVVVVPGQYWSGGGRNGVPAYSDLQKDFNLPEASLSRNTLQRKN